MTDVFALGWWLVAIPLVMIVVFGGLSAWTGREYVFTCGKVTGVVGRMGKGKSLFVTSKVLFPAARAMHANRLVCVDSGRPVTRFITNSDFYPEQFGFDIDVVRLDPADGDLWTQLDRRVVQVENDDGEFEDRLDAIIWIDEAHLFAPGGNYRLDDDANELISMFRKLNAELWWATQHEMKVHATLRRDTDLIWLPQRAQNTLTKLLWGRSNWFVASAYPSELVDRGRQGKLRPEERRWFRLTPAMKRAYRSFQRISRTRPPEMPTNLPPAPPGYRLSSAAAPSPTAPTCATPVAPTDATTKSSQPSDHPSGSPEQTRQSSPVQTLHPRITSMHSPAPSANGGPAGTRKSETGRPRNLTPSGRPVPTTNDDATT